MPDVTFDNKNYAKFYSLLIVLFATTLFAGQYFIERKEFNYLIGWQLLLHLVFISFYFTRKYISLQQLFFAAIILRIGSAFIVPSLSDDVYRFIWDGQLIVAGQNPLLTTPDNYLSALRFTNTNYEYFRHLHTLINHPQFYTCYPPLMQGAFTVAAFFGGSSVFISIVIIKLIVAIVDCVAVYFIIKILRKINADVKLVVLYALNPLVIIEGAGNAHFEVMQVALLVISIYFILEQKLALAALFWGFAIVTKLLPLLLLPLVIRLLGFKKGLLFSSIAVGVVILLFLPFLTLGSVDGFAKSLNLYFQNFEFNASLYYLAREIGWWLVGFNFISFIGPFLMVVFLSIYAVIFFMKKKLSLNEFALHSLVILSLYYFFATTVHPWYIINLLPFALMANKKYAFLWMGIAFLSYNAYGNINFKENYYLVFFEYLVVVVAIFYSFKKDKIISSV